MNITVILVIPNAICWTTVGTKVFQFALLSFARILTDFNEPISIRIKMSSLFLQ